MEVKKLIIPVAGLGTRFFPFTKVVAKELLPILNKPAIHYLVDEATKSGIEEVIFIVSYKKTGILKYFEDDPNIRKIFEEKNKIKFIKYLDEINSFCSIVFAIQNQQLGLGNAIAVASELVEDEPFAIILGDDLVDSKVPAIKQLIDTFNEKKSSVVGVQKVLDRDISKYGIVKPKYDNYHKEERSFEITGAIEKPEIKDAPSKFAILGRYVFTPKTMKILRKLKISDVPSDEINLVDAFPELLETEKIYASIFEGNRYDLGSIEGFVKATIDYSLKNKEISSKISEFLKEKEL
ncbi:MAG: sugar phosphate nucleotidyltransferase [Mycoplasma sp.]|nr:sugar phosphate nucleotidyltransferase [Mycoplasma sp.]